MCHSCQDKSDRNILKMSLLSCHFSTKKQAPKPAFLHDSFTFDAFISLYGRMDRETFHQSFELFHGQGHCLIGASWPLIHTVGQPFGEHDKSIPIEYNSLDRRTLSTAKRNNVPSSSGSIPYSRRMIETRPSIPRRMSVLPARMMTFLKPPFPSLSIAKNPDH